MGQVLVPRWLNSSHAYSHKLRRESALSKELCSSKNKALFDVK